MPNEGLLEVKNLKKFYGKVTAVSDISLKIRYDQVIMLVGANGAGKTTFLNIIAGLTEADDGEIILSGENITRFPPHKRAKKGIIKTFQLEHVFESMTVFDHIRTACISADNKHYLFFKNINNEREINERAEEIIELFDLTEVKNVFVKSLGHGYRKVIDIATSFAMKPKILLIDEPTSGIGEEEKYRIMDLLMDQITAKKLSAIIVEHDLNLVKDLGRETIVMHEGQFIARGNPGDVFCQDNVIDILVGRGF